MSSGRKTLEINKQGVSRRQLLALTSAGLAAGLSGCASGDDPTETGTDPGSTGSDEQIEATPTEESLEPGELMESTVDVMDGNTPEEVNMNRFALNTGYHFIVRGYSGIITNAMTEPTYVIYDGDGTYYDESAKTWHYTVKEDQFHWANGDPITAEDFYTELMVSQLQLSEEDRWVEEVNLLNEWEWEVTAKRAPNPLVQGYATGRLALNKGYERGWLEALQDATTDQERDEITADIVNTRIDIQEFIDEGMASGVWKPVDWDETSVTFEKNEGHAWADEFVYDRLIAHTCDGAACDELMKNDDIDVGPGQYPTELRDVSPGHLRTIHESRARASRNLYFRNLNEHTGNRWVRRALFTVLDLNFLVDFWQGEGGFIKQNQSGMDRSLEARYFDSEFIDSLYEYPIGGDEELASEFMRQGGYERNGQGKWAKGGEVAEFDFASPSGSLYMTLSQAINDVWQGFGVEPNLTARDWGYLVPNLQDGTGDIDVTLWLSGWSRGDPRDYFNPTNPFFLHLYTPGTDDPDAWLDEGYRNSQNNGRPIVVEIPEDPGDIYLEGSTREINLLDRWEDFLEADTRGEAIEVVRDFVVYFNYDLPRPDLFPQVNALWGDTRSWQFDEDNPLYYTNMDRAKHLVHRFGVMQGRRAE